MRYRESKHPNRTTAVSRARTQTGTMDRSARRRRSSAAAPPTGTTSATASREPVVAEQHVGDALPLRPRQPRRHQRVHGVDAGPVVCFWWPGAELKRGAP